MSDKAVTNQAMSVETAGQVLKAAETLDKDHGLMNPRYAVMLARDLLAAQARVKELEATIARALERVDAWYTPDGHIDPQDARNDCAGEMRDILESALATPGKAMGE